jgi:hypothetical protein
MHPWAMCCPSASTCQTTLSGDNRVHLSVSRAMPKPALLRVLLMSRCRLKLLGCTMQDVPDGVATAGRRRGRGAPAAGGRAHKATSGLPPGVARQRAAPLHHVGADPAARLHVRFHQPLML